MKKIHWKLPELCFEGGAYNNTEFSTLPKEIGKFSNLLELTIDCSQLRGFNVEINKLSKLRILTIQGAKEMEGLPETLSLPQLEDLSFRGNSKLKDFSALKNMPNLKSFSYAPYNGSSLTAIPVELYQLKNLEVLNFFGNNNLQISSNICKLSNLVSLNLGSGYIQLPECLGNLTKLKQLSLWGAEFTKSEIQELKKKYPHLKIYHQYGDKK